MTYLEALSNQYASWRSQLVLYFGVFLVGTSTAVVLELQAALSSAHILTLISVATVTLLIVLPAIKTVAVTVFTTPPKTELPRPERAKHIEEEATKKSSALRHSTWSNDYAYMRQIR